MTRRPLRALAVTAVLAVAGTAAADASAGPVATASKSCSVRGREAGFGPTSVTSLSVRGTTCAEGERVVKAYHACRVKAGGPSGRCVRKVRGFACREQRSGIATQFSATVSCAKNRATVRHTYTQST